MIYKEPEYQPIQVKHVVERIVQDKFVRLYLGIIHEFEVW